MDAAAGTGITLTAGFVAWLLRGGSLLASLMGSMPLWKGFDPLPVLAGAAAVHNRNKHRDGEDDEQNDEEKEIGRILDGTHGPHTTVDKGERSV